MRTYKIVKFQNDLFRLGERDFFLPVGEAVTAQEIVDHLNEQASPFLSFFVAQGERVGYSYVDHKAQTSTGFVEL